MSAVPSFGLPQRRCGGVHSSVDCPTCLMMDERDALRRAGQVMSASIGAYALALARRHNGKSTDDQEIQEAISACVSAKRTWDSLAP